MDADDLKNVIKVVLLQAAVILVLYELGQLMNWH